jgi:hypothetical protein
MCEMLEVWDFLQFSLLKSEFSTGFFHSPCGKLFDKRKLDLCSLTHHLLNILTSFTKQIPVSVLTSFTKQTIKGCQKPVRFLRLNGL